MEGRSHVIELVLTHRQVIMAKHAMDKGLNNSHAILKAVQVSKFGLCLQKKKTYTAFLSSFSINLLAFYHECCSLVAYATRYLFKQWRVSVEELSADNGTAEI